MRAALALVLVLAACAPGQADEAARGQRLAQERCAACHAIGRTGASPRAGAPPFRDLHNRYPVDQLAESLAEGIVTGHPDMPEQAFSPEEVNALIAYLRSLER
ncbi:cytochrome c [Roseomonas eburnea]|uniref:Cytochrome c n=1 Tax=Neoroseomonas eburnea TaxID=1346889 RepID=A0A9X9XJ05_9PROT|nr:cytochrome c [Neoroseomonas eburnea]MBR0683691.1 cytochrome c [Neoroseomonas eburnea]